MCVQWEGLLGILAGTDFSIVFVTGITNIAITQGQGWGNSGR